jgi:hypothetical protein
MENTRRPNLKGTVSPKKQTSIAAFLSPQKQTFTRGGAAGPSGPLPTRAATAGEGQRQKQQSWHAVTDADINSLWPSQWLTSRPLPAPSEAPEPYVPSHEPAPVFQYASSLGVNLCESVLSGTLALLT